MNKNKLFKTINELKNNINKNLEKHPNISLYVNSWVIGSLDMLEHKAKGEKMYIYPYGATYKQLFGDFVSHFFCLHISREIEYETKKYLQTEENFLLVQQLKKIILG